MVGERGGGPEVSTDVGPDVSVAGAKRRLRAQVRARRAARTGAEREAVARGLLETAGQCEALCRAQLVAAYVAVPGEPDPALLRAALREVGVVVLLPVAGPDGQLGWGLDDDRLHPGAALPSGLVIDEPDTRAGPLGPARADVVLLPASAVDLAGARLGQGGGYYDRALAAMPAPGRRPLLVAVVHDDEVLEVGDVPAAPHDRPVDAVLTPTRWLDLRS